MMRNLSTACLLACALFLSSGNATALSSYEGPQDAVTRTYTVSGVVGCTNIVNANFATFSAFIACFAALNGSGHVGEYSCGNAGPWFAYTVENTSIASCSAVWYRFSGGTGSTACGAALTPCTATISQMATSCGSNRSIGVISGTTYCVSKCYSLRGSSVTAFVPIDDPASTVPAACLFLSGTGTCMIEVVDTSNFTYGSQLYRGGTWEHVGQQCQEDPTSAPTTGAINTSPTGTTGSGSGGTTSLSPTDSANLAATKTAAQGTESSLNANLPAIGDTLTSLKNLSEEFFTGLLDAGEMTADGEGASTAQEIAEDEIALLRSTANAASQLNLDALSAGPGEAPQFLGTESRWLFSLDPFIGGSAECSHSWTVSFPGLAVQTWTLNICPWAPYFRAFMFWVLMLTTAWGLWSTVYARAARGE